MQESAYHVVLNARGFETIGQRRERSLWWQVLSHAFREDPKGSGEAALAVDGATGVVSLRLGAAAGALTLLPRPAAVEGVLAVLAAARPGQAELEPRSVPVRWVHVLRPAGDGSGRIDVRPFLEARLPGPHRFPLDELRPFLHGTLVWLGPVGAFVRLPAGKLPAAATAGPDELPELLDGIARDHGDEAVEATEGVGPARLFRRPDGVSVRPAVEGWDWLDLRYRFGRGSVALRDLLAARRAGRRYLGVGDGWVDLASDDLTAADQDLAAALPGERRQASPLELLRLQARTGGVFQVEGEGEEAARLRALVELRPLRPYAPPPGLASTLRPYQERGVEWLRFLWDNGLGGLLCDDMGLGKTHQTLALLLQLRAEGVREPSLVVCPTSVLSHWRDKARAHAPGLRVALHHGAERSLDDAVAASDLVVASYGVLRRDADRLRAIRFAVVAFDEAQNLKGRGTQVHQAARQLDARLRLGLTGTPVENSVADLKALLDLTLPGYLGSDLAFERRYLGGDGAPVAPWRLDELRRLTAPFALRRLKDAVLAELPDKVVDRRTCALSDQQAALYREAIQGRGRALVARLERRDEAVPYVHVFALIDLLKQVCDHPALATGQLERAEEMASGKWELFVELLDEALGSGHKVVVFSQYLGMLELMARHLDRLQVGHARLTGQSRNRGELVRRFNDDADCRVFLASLLAGGTGIDLVGGSVVIHYDRWWNAAREDQATDRVHRIGQRRSVQVFKLVTEGTLEERIEAIVERKRALLAAVVRPDDPEVGKALTRDELLDILRPL
jgi:superfamily II DNA or RNA helicase